MTDVVCGDFDVFTMFVSRAASSLLPRMALSRVSLVRPFAAAAPTGGGKKKTGAGGAKKTAAPPAAAAAAAPPPPPPKAAAAPPKTSPGSLLTELSQQNPHVDVVRYTHKNRTWTVGHVEYYSSALAVGLTEQGLIAGDVVLSWLPPHFSEQVREKFYICLPCFSPIERSPFLFTCLDRWFYNLLAPRRA
jgi:hypothetical protein